MNRDDIRSGALRSTYDRYIGDDPEKAAALQRAIDEAKQEQADYDRLVAEFLLDPIRSDEELRRAVAMMDGLSNREALTLGEEEYVDDLAELIEEYRIEKISKNPG